ncbi:MAG TPA: IS630 family transposase [Acidimicrobiales bacterium]|nr:IS630 family transposase [Acidimicrobiales bacterium]
MTKYLRVRRLTDEEGRQIQRIVRRGGGSTDKSIVKWRRALVVQASAGGNTVPVIARLVATSEDRVREMIHRFNELGMRSLDPQWAGGRPRLITTDDVAFIVATATTRPEALGRPFTRWSIRKLVEFLADNTERIVVVGRERCRQILADNDITFQRTKTWKESNDPDRDAKLDRIEHVLEHHPDRTFAFDEFGPLAIRPVGGCAWAPAGKPQRQPANYHKLHGVRQFHGCYSVGDDELWGVVRHRKSGVNTLHALRSIRARRPDNDWIYVILDNLSAHKGQPIRRWAAKNNVELCFTATYSSWANPIEAHFGPLREFVLNNSNHPNHVTLTHRLHAHLRWRNANARAPEVLAAQRRERARVRAEKGRRWGRPASKAA